MNKARVTRKSRDLYSLVKVSGHFRFADQERDEVRFHKESIFFRIDTEGTDLREQH